MNTSIPFSIITPTSSRTIAINQLSVQTLRGQLTLLPGHEPTYIILKDGSTVTWTAASDTKSIQKEDPLVVHQAILEVKRDSLTLIIATTPTEQLEKLPE